MDHDRIHRWHVDATEPGRPPKVTIDGVEVPGVVQARVAVEPGALPGLLLEVLGVGTLDGLGIVAQLEPAPEPVDAAAAVVEFLAGLDPEEVTERALDRLQWQTGRGKGSTTSAVLEVLRERVTGGA